jgi:hypothetical protein
MKILSTEIKMFEVYRKTETDRQTGLRTAWQACKRAIFQGFHNSVDYQATIIQEMW